MKFLAYHVKGLGDVVLKEISDNLEVEVLGRSEKYIIFKSSRDSISGLLQLRTPDDIHLLLFKEDLRERPGNEEIVESFPLKKLAEAEALIESYRSSGNNFSLTVSRYMNDRIEKDELEDDLAEEISRETGWDFSQNSGFDLRIHVEEKRVLISIRLSEKPLYFRDYYQEGMKGSLKTSIAASLVEVADPVKEEKLVDNFCGAGTILCEAADRGLEVSGGDIEREAVKAARKNLGEVDPEAAKRVQKLDATTTDHPDDYFNLAVSNLPWGKQVDVNAVELYSRAIKEYSRILKSDAGIVILGKHPELAEKYIRKNFPRHNVESFQLGFLGQNPSVTFAEKNS